MADEQPRRLEHASAGDLAPLERVIDPAYPERMRDMATVVYLALKGAGPDVPAEQLALAVTNAVSEELGGAYMHKGSHYRAGRQAREIVAEFNGRNLHLLARKHRLTEMRVRQILDAHQRAEFERKQGRLLGDD